MAECSTINLIVSGAGITAANGTYTKYVAEDATGYSRWSNDNGFSIYHGDPGNDYWFILQGSTPKYRTVANSTDCPVGLTWELMPFGSPTPPAPTVTAGSAPVVDPIAARNAKYSTATESGSARFRRLVSLGYV